MVFLCIGDSHSSFFSGLGTKENKYMQPVYNEEGCQQNILPYFKAIRIGAATAYQLINKLPILENIVSDNKDHSILFCFGEVDCRLHLPKRILVNNENEYNVVSECVDRYFQVIYHFHLKNIKCAVWGVIGSNPPSLPYPDMYKVGAMEQRNKITIVFNKLLKTKCEQYNIPFVSIFDTMVTNYITDPKYIQDNIHLSQELMPKTLELFKDLNLL
jgi:hypothetical protein